MVPREITRKFGTNWNRRKTVKTYFFPTVRLIEHSNRLFGEAVGCLSCRYSKLNWTWLWSPHSRWPCFGGGGELNLIIFRGAVQLQILSVSVILGILCPLLGQEPSIVQTVESHGSQDTVNTELSVTSIDTSHRSTTVRTIPENNGNVCNMGHCELVWFPTQILVCRDLLEMF